MIKSFYSKKAERFMNSVIPNNMFWSYNPVIAGGAALSLDRSLKIYDTNQKWKSFEREFLAKGKNAKFDKFGDLDVCLFSLIVSSFLLTFLIDA